MSTSSSTVPLSWRRSETEVREPIVANVPYFELKLEHPSLEPTRFRDAFFPDAVPYRTDDECRIFYWQPTLDSAAPAAQLWEGVCATTHALTAVTDTGPVDPSLWERAEDGHEIVVDGTIAGDSTTTSVRDYTPPDVAIRSITPATVRLNVDNNGFTVAAGTRKSVQLSPQSVSPLSEIPSKVTISPRLIVRFPGTRTVYHPARKAEYVLFPSFGLDLDDLPNPVPVPTTNNELDHDALASVLDVDFSARPYPERVLWQAFAFNAFEPSRDSPPRLVQYEELLALRNPL